MNWAFAAKTRRVIADCCDWLFSWVLALRARRVKWEVAQIDGVSRVTKEGVPYYLKGVAGWEYVRLDDIRVIGGNSFRGMPDLRGLNKAWRKRIHVLVNLPTVGEEHGLDWDDAEQVERQKRRITRLVRKFRHHPAVMMWSVGNELDLIPFRPQQTRPHNPRLWHHLNDLAKAVKRADPNRLVCVCTGTGVFEDFEGKITRIVAGCTDVDLLGINNFRDTAKIIPIINRIWNRAYFFSEWGCTPNWRVPETRWGAELEPASSEKAAIVSGRYRNHMLPAARCVGGFLFFWGERFERTHTWFGLFFNGMRTQMLDVMQKHWTGSWPESQTPSVFKVTITGWEKERDIALPAGKPCEARVHYRIPGDRKGEITWEVRREVERVFSAFSGHGERHDGPVPLRILMQESGVVRFITPEKPGPYRLYVQVTDDGVSGGHANIPFLVEV